MCYNAVMVIEEIEYNKESFIDILLAGDEQESMVRKYLEKCTLFALYDDDLKSVCAITEVDEETIEIKNLATYARYQNKGYATMLIDFVCNKYKKKYKFIVLGTGENEKTLTFYKKRGFFEYGKVKNFFTDNYDHPIFENGRQLIDMIYLKKNLC